MKHFLWKLSLLSMGIMSIILMSSQAVVATGSCQLKTFYSKKDWVTHEEFIDTTFLPENTNFLNSAQVLASVNVLGTFSNANHVSDKTLLGQLPIQLTRKADAADPTHFSIAFGKTIRVQDITFEMSAYTLDHNPVEKVVYINGHLVWQEGRAVYQGGKEVARSKEDRLELNLQGQEVNNITVLFEQSPVDYIYYFQAFQIHHYQVEEHVAWVETYLPNTDIRQIYTCLDGGTFSPDGTGGAWKKEASTVFTPSTKLLVTKVPSIESQVAIYDYGRGGNISAYTLPNVIKDIDPYAKLIQGWNVLDNADGYYRSYSSYGSGGALWPWIMTSPDQGVLYQVFPVYWSQDRSQPNQLADSTDGPWCQHTTGNWTTPCYKYAGHSGNPRLNSYDVVTQTYRDLYDPAMHHITSTIYTLIDLDSGKRQELTRNADPSTYFSFTDTGRWKIESDLQDELGNHAKVYSQPFYIDKIPPEISFTPLPNQGWSNKEVSVRIGVLDQHSGLDYWRYAISYDAGKTYTPYQRVQSSSQTVLLDQSGIVTIKVEAYDQLGNKSFHVSLPYYLDFLPPVSEKTWLQDDVSKTLFYDSLTGKQDRWVNAQHQLTLSSQPVVDRPREYASGVKQVVAKLATGKEVLLTQTAETLWQANLSEDKGRGNQSLSLQACDNANNCAILQEVSWKSDPDAPVVKTKLVPEEWTNQSVLIQVEATDSLSGVAYVKDPSGKVSNQPNLNYAVEENGVYSFSSEDKAGNAMTFNVPVTNIDKIKPTAIFDSGGIVESKEEIPVTITPQDFESGVKKWRYKISYDQGESFFYTSPYQNDDKPKDITLTYAGNCIIVVEVIDRAGNSAEITSNLFTIFRGDAEISGLVSEVYSKNEPQNLYLRVRCLDCDPKRTQTIKIFQDDVMLDERKLETLPEQTLSYSYTALQDSTLLKAVVEYDVDSEKKNNELTLRASVKTYQFQQTDQLELYFEAPTVFTATQDRGQVNYNETLTLHSEIEKSSYFSGQGIEAAVVYQYENQCGEFKSWACKTTTVLDITDSFALFNQGALPVRTQYESEGRYKVGLIHQGNSLKLPFMYATLHEGLINNQPVFDNLQSSDEILEAGHKWYTDPLLKEGNLVYSLSSMKCGKNEFSWIFNREAKISNSWMDEVRYHFVNPNDATTFSSEIWKSDLQWFPSLHGKTPLYQVELEKE